MKTRTSFENAVQTVDFTNSVGRAQSARLPMLSLPPDGSGQHGFAILQYFAKCCGFFLVFIRPPRVKFSDDTT